MAAMRVLRCRMPRHLLGVSIVETLVGLATGLVVLAGATTLAANQLREQRALLVDVRTTQDLRSAADLIARELRRAGYWADAAAGIRPDTAGAAAPPSNPYAALAPLVAASDATGFSYSRDAVEDHAVGGDERTGFRLHGQAVEMRVGDAWQTLTDAATLVVTAFDVVPRVDEIDLSALCNRPCDAGASADACPPRQQLRRLTVLLVGHSAGHPAAVHRAVADVRLRNDAIVGACAG